MNASLFGVWYCIPQRPHHLATVLMKAGWGVNVYTTRSIKSIKPNIEAAPSVNTKYLLPSKLTKLPIVGEAFHSQNDYCLRRSIIEFANSEADLFIHYNSPGPWSEEIVRKGSKNFVYDCVDDWEGFPGAHPKIREWEAELCERADQIWVVSRHLEQKLSRWAPKVKYVPNGVDYLHFSRAAWTRSANLALRTRKRLIYVGAIFDWFDARLVGEVARRLFEWDLILIGPTRISAVQAEYLDRDNIFFLGRKDYHELPDLLANAHVAMIPFVINDLIRGTSPIKLYEYLAAGLPVVATLMPEVLPYIENGVVGCAEDPSEFARTVEELAASANPDRCQEVARTSTWEARFLPLLKEFVDY